MATDLSGVFSKIDPIRSAKLTTEDIKYGTAGFRAHADGLDFVVYRVGLIAAIRSKSFGGKVIGLMITASHNPEQDNGVKLVDPLGEMLEAKWEAVATRIANSENYELADDLRDVVTRLGIDWAQKTHVFLGRDTRPSSLRLSEHAKAAVEAIGGSVVDCGVLTTPMLHYFVAEANRNGSAESLKNDNYYSKLSNAFIRLNSDPSTGNYAGVVHFDGANGVGALAMRELAPKIATAIKVEIFNTGTGRLNYMCGSDYVKVNMKAPDGVPIEADVRSVAVDGDADRLIYFYLDRTRKVHILDGDRIAILLALYLKELLNESGLELNLGLVQTAYANGNATRYITDVLKVPLAWTETGVKHLHHKALEYDIGVYFEANGHGTVVYSEKTVAAVKNAANGLTGQQQAAARRLWDVIELTNQAVGDALSDFLLVETVLKAKGWSAADWEACYADLPSRLLKVSIKNREVVTNTGATGRCLTPKGLQEKIDSLVAEYPQARSFVRPSGTEDVVRVYAEAATQAEADELGLKVSQAVFDLAVGVGPRPERIA